ncbi:MAG: hypothetical protein NC087_09910 [Anaeroplasma bactoclasticum]|nr:hypothetical protein [Anaeroplasma bactoclasticum]
MKLKNKFYNNSVYWGLMILLSLLVYGLIPLLYFTPNSDTSLSGRISLILIYIISALGGTFLLTYGTISFGARIQFDEKGIHKSVLVFFFKKTITWDELFMIQLFGFWCAFTKEDLTNQNWNKSKTRRKTIYLVFDENVYAIIRKYTSTEIIGYNENK